ncbi:MAG: hypothetical protein ABII25_08865 [bacterium]
MAKHKKENKLDCVQLEAERKAQEINEIELKMWYEDSVFRKVSEIEYSEKLARSKYEIFLRKSLKQKPPTEPEDEPDGENEIINEPLFRIKLKK